MAHDPSWVPQPPGAHSIPWAVRGALQSAHTASPRTFRGSLGLGYPSPMPGEPLPFSPQAPLNNPERLHALRDLCVPHAPRVAVGPVLVPGSALSCLSGNTTPPGRPDSFISPDQGHKSQRGVRTLRSWNSASRSASASGLWGSARSAPLYLRRLPAGLGPRALKSFPQWCVIPLP